MRDKKQVGPDRRVGKWWRWGGNGKKGKMAIKIHYVKKIFIFNKRKNGKKLILAIP